MATGITWFLGLLGVTYFTTFVGPCYMVLRWKATNGIDMCDIREQKVSKIGTK